MVAPIAERRVSDTRTRPLLITALTLSHYLGEKLRSAVILIVDTRGSVLHSAPNRFVTAQGNPKSRAPNQVILRR